MGITINTWLTKEIIKKSFSYRDKNIYVLFCDDHLFADVDNIANILNITNDEARYNLEDLEKIIEENTDATTINIYGTKYYNNVYLAHAATPSELAWDSYCEFIEYVDKN